MVNVCQIGTGDVVILNELVVMGQNFGIILKGSRIHEVTWCEYYDQGK
jgi:hypothetical protein